MTDTEVMFAFSNGCALLKDDNVEYEDLAGIRKILDDCACNLMPYVHTYVLQEKQCKNCKHLCVTGSDAYCNYKSSCYRTFDRPKFKESKHK